MAVYGLDIFTAVTMISSSNVSEVDFSQARVRHMTPQRHTVESLWSEQVGN
jgi:hypothetical protein